MSLRVWMPLTKDLRQQGLDSTTITQNSGTAISSGGKLGSCLTATSNATIVVDLPSLATMLANGKSYSLACWVKITGNVTTNSWIIKLGTNNCGLWWAASTARWVWNENDDGKRCADPTISSDTTNWHHLVTTVTKSSNGSVTTARHYVDGEPANSYEVQTWDNSGKAQPAGTTITISPYAASLNDIRLYDHCLSPMEIKELAKGLVLHYPLNRQGFGQENLAKASTSTTQMGSSPELKTLTFSGWDNYCNQNLDLTSIEWNALVGTKITYRMWLENVEQTVGTGTGIMLHFRYADGTYQQFGGGKNGVIGSYLTQGESGWVWLTVTVPDPTTRSNPTTISYVQYSIRHNSNTGASTVKYQYAKIEKGEIATPWCPNSSDEMATTLGLNNEVEYDISGFGNNGTRVGSMTWSSDTPKYSVSTSIVQGLNFIQLPVINPTGFTNSWTFAMWVKTNDPDSFMTWGTSNGNRLNFFVTSSYVANNTGDSGENPFQKNGTNISPSLINNNTWHHIVVTGNGSTNILYIDGNEAARAKTYKPLTGTQYFISGWDTSNTSYRINGSISDFRLYTTALSANDVKSLYQNCATIGPDGTIYGKIRN